MSYPPGSGMALPLPVLAHHRLIDPLARLVSRLYRRNAVITPCLLPQSGRGTISWLHHALRREVRSEVVWRALTTSRLLHVPLATGETPFLLPGKARRERWLAPAFAVFRVHIEERARRHLTSRQDHRSVQSRQSHELPGA